MGGEGDPQEIAQEIQIWLSEQVIYAQRDAWNFLGLSGTARLVAPPRLKNPVCPSIYP